MKSAVFAKTSRLSGEKEIKQMFDVSKKAILAMISRVIWCGVV
jgi:hypothetical protein